MTLPPHIGSARKPEAPLPESVYLAHLLAQSRRFCPQAVTMKLFLSLLLATSTSALVLPSQAALGRQSINMPARSLARMSEEKPAAATSEQAQAEPGAAVDFTPKPVAEAPKEMGIDWSK